MGRQRIYFSDEKRRIARNIFQRKRRANLSEEQKVLRNKREAEAKAKSRKLKKGVIERPTPKNIQEECENAGRSDDHTNPPPLQCRFPREPPAGPLFRAPHEHQW